MSRPHRLEPWGIVVYVIGLAIVLPLAPAARVRATTTLNSASYNTNISVQIANGTPDTESFTLPVASSLSYSDHSSVTDNLGGMQSAQASADAFNYGVLGGTQQIPPANVHAQGSGSFSSSDRNGGGVRFSAGSSITYQVVVTTINPPP